MDYTNVRTLLASYMEEILNVDSPSGFTKLAVEKAEEIVKRLGYTSTRTRRGNVRIRIPGREDGKVVCLAAHLDTLGLIVRGITAKGEILFDRIGGPVLPSLDGEYCRIYTRDGKVFTGTVLSMSPAKHVFPDANTRARDTENMYVRLDEPVYTKDAVTALGIANGDFICYDPKFTVTESGYVKSRFLDDKASVACFFALLQLFNEQGLKPRYTTEFVLTVNEEVGSGGATLPADADELLIVDMGCIGLDLVCTEQQVSICPKDSAGPFDYDITTRLVNLAKRDGIDYALDVYPMYSSDAAVAWRAGLDLPAGLIGTGVQASHGMERTHMDGLVNTMRLLGAYLEV